MIRCVCGHALSSHRQDPVDQWVAERCKTCGCAGFENDQEAMMQNDEEDEELNRVYDIAEAAR